MVKKKVKTKTRKRPSRARKSIVQKIRTYLGENRFKLGVVFVVSSLLYVIYLDYVVRSQFEGKRWALPAHVYANPVELYQGLPLSVNQFESLLADLRFQNVSRPSAAGMYRRSGDTFTVKTRAFTFWDAAESAQTLNIQFSENKVASILDLSNQQTLPILRLEPVRVGSFYPSHKEERVLVKIDEVPQTLIDGLIAIEDRDFYEHYGVSLKGIARALLTNLQAGKVVQGGSTLTQQLVKNFFLTSERSLWRKAKEAVMSLILEIRYEKDEILEAYLNEVFLGQDGVRSINGFGMASVFYFNQPLASLKPHQVALMVGLVKGPSYYNPRRNPNRAQERRNLVLEEMVKLELLPEEQQRIALSHGLDVSPLKRLNNSRFPAYLDLVKRQLARDYQEEDLTSEGLNIFSTLDYSIQTTAERLFKKTMDALVKDYGVKKGVLQGAMVITRREGGEIVAVIGDRNPPFNGFNRALDAIRPIGSLVKPAVYLTALEDSSNYTLITPIEDAEVSLMQFSGELWEPKNYDELVHGIVPLHSALTHSYNLATVKLGMDINVSKVKRTLERLGVNRPIKPYPSLLLGSLALPPIEVTQMYQTFAGEGFLTPLRSIQSVTSNEHERLQRYPLTVRQTVKPSAVYLTNTIMQEVMTKGTGRSAYQRLSPTLNLAGKTGTTDELRDSWFAGFSGDYLAVVWLGRDDNKPFKFTGASGALQVWSAVMGAIAKEPLQLTPPDDIEFVTVDESGLLADESCSNAVQYPFIKGSAPTEKSPCRGGLGKWLNRIFND
ncbi:MAG: penicillin-binding protein 1B [Cycloclasticus sp. symbiont of Poecilosclerida sp. M]|nr:MAG: penicillin-binding protein 1B [Cycloclasticus sp. symbiont of Poecilosclerida sp. M]